MSATTKLKTGPAEALLMTPTLRGLLRLGRVTQMSLGATEMPWHQKRLDLVVLAGSEAVAVELKVDKWRRAIEQAYVNRWCADESWIGLWHTHTTPAALRMASEAGVGVLVVTRRTIYPVVRPLAAPRAGVSVELRGALAERGARVRDLLTEVKARGLPALA